MDKGRSLELRTFRTSQWIESRTDSWKVWGGEGGRFFQGFLKIIWCRIKTVIWVWVGQVLRVPSEEVT